MRYNIDDCALTLNGEVVKGYAEFVEGYAEEHDTLDLCQFRVGDMGRFKTDSGHNVIFVITRITKDS